MFSHAVVLAARIAAIAATSLRVKCAIKNSITLAQVASTLFVPAQLLSCIVLPIFLPSLLLATSRARFSNSIRSDTGFILDKATHGHYKKSYDG